MFKPYEITAHATFEELNLTKGEVLEWIKENFEELQENYPHLEETSGYMIDANDGRFACYKNNDRGQEEWRLECLGDGTTLSICAVAELIDLDSSRVAMVEKAVLRKLQEETTVLPENENYWIRELIPENKERFCVGPDNWWMTNIELVSSYTGLGMWGYNHIDPWLAANPGKEPIDFPAIKLKGGKVIPKEHPEWFNETFHRVIQRHRERQPELIKVDQEIHETESRLRYLRKRRRDLF